MPPENKKIIYSIEEVTCGNCLLSAERHRWGDLSAEKYIACHSTSSEYFMDGIKSPKDFCSSGLWKINVEGIYPVGSRASVVEFAAAMDYLGE